jgi:hypothetical protein
MGAKKAETKVIFRKYKDGDIIALFPEEPFSVHSYCSSYMHVGQHGAADVVYVMMDTKPAKPEEYAELKRELECLGYENLKVIHRTTRQQAAVRRLKYEAQQKINYPEN